MTSVVSVHRRRKIVTNDFLGLTVSHKMERGNLLQHMRHPSKPTISGISKLLACVIPIAQITIGAVYLYDCPRQHYIPIYLVVMGATGLALALLSCIPCAQDSDDMAPNLLNHLCTTWSTLASLFLFCWFISGNVWIYSIYQPNFNQTLTEDPYCNKTLYLFAFWTTTLAYVELGLLLLGGCCMLVCAFILGKRDPDDNRS
uniref:Uncharacterized protein n=1 Tax=Oncorhynchus tshawytscha TaxID=74940 RepID=A0AAZ3R996_ONCTS